ncbi:hypothetical protein OG596_34870 [Streptomyces sp. NBC_01102]|uniref:hypothetical protein n=1 Tax=unclassified Streptomyces TaxID=2593676 RepID=UPI00386EA2C6|nr:hypothetical protein OG596_34870 [Streptomyces sp. NBC_01102]
MAVTASVPSARRMRARRISELPHRHPTVCVEIAAWVSGVRLRCFLDLRQELDSEHPAADEVDPVIG